MIFISEIFSMNKFEIGHGTSIKSESCALLVGNRMLLFGGIFTRRQVSVVYPFGVYLIQTLPFDFWNGACHFNDNTIYLGFDLLGNRLSHKR